MKFKGEIWRTGNSFVVTVPAQFVNNGALEKGKYYERGELLLKLVDIQYTRNDFDFHRGTFRVRGDIIDIFPAYDEIAYRLEFFGDELESIKKLDPTTGKVQESADIALIFPAKHFVTTNEKMQIAWKR